jgi:hypothetical protein
MGNFCEDLLKNPNAIAAFFVAIILVLALILMQMWKVGYYVEKLGSSGVEIPPDYWRGEDSTGDIVPNQFGGNSTGGMTSGAAGRFAQLNSSGTASPGDGRDYVYTKRLDTELRDYTNTDNKAFIMAHGGI